MSLTSLIRNMVLVILALFCPLWVRFPAETYYIQPNGTVASGFTEIDGETYYFSPDTNAMETGWLSLDGERYYFDGDGVMRTGINEIDGNTYYFDIDGKLRSGWVDDGGKRYFDADGRMAVGWKDIDGSRYCFSDNGMAKTGICEIDGQVYCFDGNGAMRTGWQSDDSGTRYFDTDTGMMRTGWIDDDGKRYLSEDGLMCVGWTDIDGARYYFSGDGVLCTGKTCVDGSSFYYLYEDGGYAKDTTIDDVYYDGEGVMQSLTDTYYTDGGDTYIEFQPYPLYGRLYIPDVGVSVGLGYIGDTHHTQLSQDYVDMRDTAAYLDFQDFGDDSVVIADHRTQGFERIKGCSAGMRAYIKTDESFRIYECYDIGNGYNDYDDVYDRDGNNIYYNGDGTMCLYTCNEDSHHVTVVKFRMTDIYG